MGRILSYGLTLLAIVVAGALAGLYTPDEQRAVLTAEYAQPPSVFLDVAEVRLHVRDTGPRAAPAVILLHGFGASLRTWEDWAQDLERDHRVIRYDMPGFGLTGADPSGDYTDARSIAVLLALMDRLGVARGKRRRQLDGRADRLDLRGAASGADGQARAGVAGRVR